MLPGFRPGPDVLGRDCFTAGRARHSVRAVVRWPANRTIHELHGGQRTARPTLRVPRFAAGDQPRAVLSFRFRRGAPGPADPELTRRTPGYGRPPCDVSNMAICLRWFRLNGRPRTCTLRWCRHKPPGRLSARPALRGRGSHPDGSQRHTRPAWPRW